MKNTEANRIKMIIKAKEKTEKEQNSTKIAYKAVTIDSDFSLDENLASLYDECIEAIYNSDFFQVVE